MHLLLLIANLKTVLMLSSSTPRTGLPSPQSVKHLQPPTLDSYSLITTLDILTSTNSMLFVYFLGTDL